MGYYKVIGDSPYLEDLVIATFSKIEDAENYMWQIAHNENHPDYGKYTNIRIEAGS
jgi:hypothetical protein